MAETNSTQNQCPSCGSKGVAVSGLCPKCLLAAGMGNLSPNLETRSRRSSSQVRFEPPTAEELGKEFPELEIIELAGRGGMGAVYKAVQKDLNRTVALKILPPEVAEEPTFAIRFSREARALAQLNHPNIVQVFQTGKSENYFYFLMEYVEGVNLRETIRAGKLASEAALSIIPQICDALQYAHNEGIVHRDIKPENILLDQTGKVKVTDFGLAKVVDTSNDMSLTGTQQMMGTAHYMAPEQVQETRAVDHRADIYSLGVVFYEMLTGQLPIGRFAVPSETHGIDPRLDNVVLRTLENEPDRRYQAAGDVKTDINSLNNSPSHKVQPPAREATVPYLAPSPPIKNKTDASYESSLSQTIANWIGFAFFALAVWRIWILGYTFYLINRVLKYGGSYSISYNVVTFDLVTIVTFLICGTQLLRRKGYQFVIFGCVLAIARLTVVATVHGDLTWEIVTIAFGFVSLGLVANPPVRNLFRTSSEEAHTLKGQESLEQRTFAKLRPPGLALEVLGYLGVALILLITLLATLLMGFQSNKTQASRQLFQSASELNFLLAVQDLSDIPSVHPLDQSDFAQPTIGIPQPSTRVSHAPRTDITFVALAGLWLFYLTLAIAMIIAGRKMRRCRWYMFCIAVCVALMLPAGPAIWAAISYSTNGEHLATWLLLFVGLPAIVKIGVALWCLAILGQTQVRQTFANRKMALSSVK